MIFMSKFSFSFKNIVSLNNTSFGIIFFLKFLIVVITVILSEVDFNNFIRFKFLLELKNLSESTMSYGISSVPGINIISLLLL